MKEQDRSSSEETIRAWQPHSDKQLTPEDAREIRENIVSLFLLLREWSDRETQTDNGY